jgi:choline dehydrogenase-like flavoprotein
MSSDTHYHAIVIGSGAGGAAAAYRLARAGLGVLVLEKGERLPADGSTLDIKRVVHDGAFLSREAWVDGRRRPLVPEEHFNVGGKTVWYGAAVARFAPDEFAAEPAYGCSGWPIAYSDLEPYYAEAERLLDVRTFAAEPALAAILRRLAGRPRGWHATPLPMALSAAIIANHREAAHFDGFASVAGLKGDANTAMLARIASLPNLRIETGAEVVELLALDGAGTRVAGVRLADGRRYEAGTTLLAAGALHSPRLLQRFIASRGLAAGLPAAAAVGRRLKMHLLTALVAVSPGIKDDLLRKTMLLTHPAYPHSSVQPLGFDGELIGTLVPRIVPRPVAAVIGARAYGFFLQTEDGSDPANRVFETATGGAVERVLDYDANRTPAAAREHRQFVRGFQLALLRAGMPSFTQRIGLKGTAHVCGTLAAGTDPATSVVDATGRVHGLESLYVVDGSVLPRSSRVNPSLTIFAWSLRVADLLARSQGADRPAGREARAPTARVGTFT